MEIKVLGWIKKIDLFEKANRSKEERFYKTKSRQTKRIKIVKLEKIWRKIKGTLKSFKVNKCIVSMDTGDMQLNGILYPVFYLASVYTKRNIQINFVEENVIIIEMENSLARMSWAYISS